MNNCHTCKHNSREPVGVSDDPEDGMINHCSVAVPDHGKRRGRGVRAVQKWIDDQRWDAECMCPKVTTPCPGFKARA